MRTSIGIFFICLFTKVIIPSISVEINEYFPDERDTLVKLRDSVNSTSNLHANWTGPPCNNNKRRRAGIGCSNGQIQLTGSLQPTFLQNLNFLTKLSFKNNSLHGPLPVLTNLVRLQFIFLSSNRFSGSIPSSYIDLPELTELELQENDISGQIPPFDQQSLVSFNVSHNNLQGQVPQTPILLRFSKSSYDNNSDLCGIILGLRPCPINAPPPGTGIVPSPSPVTPKDKNGGTLELWSIALIAAAAVLVPLSVVLIFLFRIWE